MLRAWAVSLTLTQKIVIIVLYPIVPIKRIQAVEPIQVKPMITILRKLYSRSG